MLSQLISILGPNLSKAPQWLLCALMLWVAIELNGLQKSMEEVKTTVEVVKMRMDDHIRYASKSPWEDPQGLKEVKPPIMRQ